MLDSVIVQQKKSWHICGSKRVRQRSTLFRNRFHKSLLLQSIFILADPSFGGLSSWCQPRLRLATRTSTSLTRRHGAPSRYIHLVRFEHQINFANPTVNEQKQNVDHIELIFHLPYRWRPQDTKTP